MAMKVTKLTPEQEARMAEFRDQWTAHGLSTAPADRPTAERAIAMMYEAAGLPPPKKIVWCGSPLSQGLTRAIILDKKLSNEIGASVGASVWASVRASVWDSVRDSVRDSVWASVGDSVGDSVYGQHDAYWLAFYRYFHDVTGLTAETEKLHGLWLLCQSAGWAIPHKEVCWVSERHHVLERDDRGRLHNVTGPALAYPDGWSIYAVHGVRVPEWIITTPGEITVEKIEAEANAEIRRVMVELYGQDKYLLDSGASISQRDAVGILYRKELSGDEPIVMVRVLNSTPEPDGVMSREEAIEVFGDAAKAAIDAPEGSRFKQYMIRVPPDISTAHDAVAWTFGLRGEEYHPAIES